MSENDVCRLCLANKNLVWVFDKKLESVENMAETIFITTGVQIYMKDLISQKICNKCCQVAIKMFQFRSNSLKNDKFLKDQCKEYLKNTKMKIPNTSVTIKSDKSVGKEEEKKEVKPATYRIHPSVTDLFKSYPQIKLPTICLKSHIAPCVSMTMDAVENYFKSRNLDFRKCTQLVLRSNRTAKKKTMAISAKSNTSKYSEKLVPPKTNKSDKYNHGNHVVSTSKKENGISENVAPVSSKDEKVQPINIKIGEAKDSFKIVDISTIKNANIPDASDTANVEDNLDFTINNKSSNDIENTSKSKKRKISETDFLDTREAKKPDFIESLGLAPTQKIAPLAVNANDETPASLSYLGKSVPLFICDICNSIQYNARDLKKHQYRHLRCQFCRTRFKTMELKTLHIENSCIVKMTMNNLPTIPLEKIEYDIDVRRMYPDAFIDFPAIPGLELRTEDTLNAQHPTSFSPDSTKSQQLLNILTDTAQPVTSQRHIPEENSTAEVIEILSDEEEPTKKTTNEPNKKNFPMDPPAKEVIAKPFPNSENVSAQLPNNNLPLQDNVVYNTVSIVKPDLKIRNSRILDNLDPKGTDIKILKELLQHQKNLDFQVNKDTQTELPTNDLIFVNRRDLTTDLKNLKHQLYVYKIPVIIKNGTFQVSYEQCVTSKTPKNMCLWDNLIPIDITINSETVESNETTPLSHDSSPLPTHTVSDNFNKVLETGSVNATNQLPNNVFPTNLLSETTGNTPKTNTAASKNLISTSSHLNTSSIPPISSTVNLLTNKNIPIIYSGNIVSDKHCPSTGFSSASTIVSNSSTSIIAKENTPPPLSHINNSSINSVLVQSISCANPKTNLNSELPTSSPSISETNYTDTSLVSSVASSANQLVAVSNSMKTYTPPCSIIRSANQLVANENIVAALSRPVNNSKNYFGPFGGMSTSLLPLQASVVNSAPISVTMNNSIINSVQETTATILLPTVPSISPVTTATTEPSNHLTSPINNTVACENNVPNVNISSTSSSFIMVGASSLESAATTISNSQVTDGLANSISEFCNTTQINHQLIASNSLVTSPKLIAFNPLVPNKDTSPTASIDCPPVLPASTTLPADTSNVIMPGIIKVRNVLELMEDGHSNII